MLHAMMLAMRYAATLLIAGISFAAERIPIGLTTNERTIESLSPGGDPRLPLIAIVGGLTGDAAEAKLVRDEIAQYEVSAKLQRRFRVIAVPMGNPAAVSLRFPPAGIAYREHAEAHYLWRWLQATAPDLLLVVGEDRGLVAALDRIPARSVPAKKGMLAAVEKEVPKSEAHLEIERRLSRTPRQVAEQLSAVYGHEFKDPVYIPAMALIARLRLGQADEVERLAAPFADGGKDSLAQATGSHTAGHLLFAALAERSADPRYTKRVLAAAEIAPGLHNEMSDSVFMACPILAKAGKLTGETRYFDLAVRHLAFMQKLCLRSDGIYRHSPLCDAAWGRGNAFPALGLALLLSDLPKEHPSFEDTLRSFQNLMAALAQFQDESGMWHEVIDRAGSYREFSATAMIGTAMARGVRNGWLDRKAYGVRVERAWRAVSARTAADGTLFDVCESTGKQKSLADYLQRAAIVGKDARGGGMMMLFATEIMQ